MDDPAAPARTIGRYVLHDEIASGGMATVHVGRLVGPVGFARTVAIKRLHPQFAKDPEVVAMFLDEARLAARIQHPNVVATLDVVALGGELFLVMEYVQGESLARLLRATRAGGGMVPPAITVAIAIGMLSGLHAAHEARSEKGESLGIVHRDVSPQNVLVSIDGVARVVDFGVAKAVGRLQTTHEGQLKGKVAYMAPEQLSQKPVDRRADVFAASIVLWEMLTGERLFQADSPAASMARVMEDPVDRPSSVAPSAPVALDSIVLRGLSRKVDDRWTTAREMAIELEAAVTPATTRQVSEWVETTVGSLLRQRASRVAEIESSSSSIARMLPAAGDTQLPTFVQGMRAASAAEPGSQMSSISVASAAAPPAKAVTRRQLALVAAVGAAAALALVLVLRPSTHPAPDPAAHASTGSTAPSSVADPSASSPAVPAAPAIVAATASASSPAPAASPASRPLPGARASIATALAAAPSKTAAPPPTPALNCSPPFTWAPDGTKIPKPECF